VYQRNIIALVVIFSQSQEHCPHSCTIQPPRQALMPVTPRMKDKCRDLKPGHGKLLQCETFCSTRLELIRRSLKVHGSRTRERGVNSIDHHLNPLQTGGGAVWGERETRNVGGRLATYRSCSRILMSSQRPPSGVTKPIVPKVIHFVSVDS
jgi:hypothetical protein